MEIQFDDIIQPLLPDVKQMDFCYKAEDEFYMFAIGNANIQRYYYKYNEDSKKVSVINKIDVAVGELTGTKARIIASKGKVVVSCSDCSTAFIGIYSYDLVEL